MSDEHPWFKMYPKDWIGDPELRLCRPAARGLLADIMALCHEGQPYGYLTRKDGSKYTESELCHILHVKPKEFRRLYAELKTRRRIMQNGSGVYVPRLVREREKLERFRKYGKRGGSPVFGRGKKKSKDGLTLWEMKQVLEALESHRDGISDRKSADWKETCRRIKDLKTQIREYGKGE